VNFEPTTNSLALTWDATVGMTYRVEYASDLAADTWTQLGENITATGPTISVHDTPESLVRQRFYRVVVVRP